MEERGCVCNLKRLLPRQYVCRQLPRHEGSCPVLSSWSNLTNFDAWESAGNVTRLARKFPDLSKIPWSVLLYSLFLSFLVENCWNAWVVRYWGPENVTYIRLKISKAIWWLQRKVYSDFLFLTTYKEVGRVQRSSLSDKSSYGYLRHKIQGHRLAGRHLCVRQGLGWAQWKSGYAGKLPWRGIYLYSQKRKYNLMQIQRIRCSELRFALNKSSLNRDLLLNLTLSRTW